jgi:hypothetical protein
MFVRGLKNSHHKERGATTSASARVDADAPERKLTEEEEMNALRAQFGLKPLGLSKAK